MPPPLRSVVYEVGLLILDQMPIVLADRAEHVQIHHRFVADWLAVVLDIRTPEEVATGTLPEAIDIDFYAPSFEAEIAALDRDTPYLVYCRSGNRSDTGVELMQELGFTQIYELEDGIVSWVESGRPLS